MVSGARPPKAKGTGMFALGFFLAVAGGFLALFAAALGQTIDRAGPVRCGERIMSPGDECVTIGGAGGTEIYAKVLADQRRSEAFAMDWHPTVVTVMAICLALGVILFIVGVIRFWRSTDRHGHPR